MPSCARAWELSHQVEVCPLAVHSTRPNRLSIGHDPRSPSAQAATARPGRHLPLQIQEGAKFSARRGPAGRLDER
jgi:hypothetical protein